MDNQNQKEQHQHTDETYSVNGVNQKGKIVCVNCHPEELQGVAECFCNCHAATPPLHMCLKCKPFHITAGDQ